MTPKYTYIKNKSHRPFKFIYLDTAEVFNKLLSDVFNRLFIGSVLYIGGIDVLLLGYLDSLLKITSLGLYDQLYNRSALFLTLFYELDLMLDLML